MQIESGQVVNVAITEAHIARGRKACPGRCPVALGTLDTLGEFLRGRVVGVNADEIWFSHMGRFYRVDSPPAVKGFVADFDAGRPVSPFAFDFTVPASPVREWSTAPTDRKAID